MPKSPGAKPSPSNAGGSERDLEQVFDFISKELYSLLMKSTISTKGQITIPAAIRSELGLTPGTRIEFELRDGGALIRKGGSGDHPVDRIFGVLQLSESVDDTIESMRGPGPNEDGH